MFRWITRAVGTCARPTYSISMTELQLSTHRHTERQCVRGEDCVDFAPGHAMPFLQERVASASPTKWLDAVVDHVEADGWVALTTLNDHLRAWVWHHTDLTTLVNPGDPVAIHGLYNVLALGRARFNVLVSDEVRR